MLGRYAHDPSEVYITLMMRYFAGTVDWKLRIGANYHGSKDVSIHMYADTDYATCTDDFQSTSGYLLSIGGAIDWKSKSRSLYRSRLRTPSIIRLVRQQRDYLRLTIWLTSSATQIFALLFTAIISRHTQHLFIYLSHAANHGRHPQGICGKATLTKEREASCRPSAGQLQQRRSFAHYSALCVRLRGRSTPIQ